MSSTFSSLFDDNKSWLLYLRESAKKLERDLKKNVLKNKWIQGIFSLY